MFKKLRLPVWLLITLGGVFLVHIPSFFEPFYYGDEMIYLTLGEGIHRGLVLYKNLHDNKPPLLYFLAAIGGNVFWLRAILCFWMIATIILFWYFMKLLFKNNKTVIASTIVFAVSISLPFFEGFVANAELFMIMPTIAAFIVAWKGKGLKSAFLAGLLLSIAALFKIPSIFDIGAIIAIWIFALQFRIKNIRHFAIKTCLLLLGIAVPISITFVWYFLRGAFHEYLVAAFLQNFGYVSSWGTGSANQIPFLVKNGPLLLRTLFVIVSFVFLFFLRKKRSKAFLFACAWLITSLFAATLSARPYPHYFIQVLPSISLLIGLLITDDSFEQALVILPLTAAFLVPVYFQFWQYSSNIYIDRFQTLLTKSSSEYFDKFSPTVERNYELSRQIVQTTTATDTVFVWGDSAAIYALSKRLPPIKYVADYHITDFSSVDETLAGLNQNPPKIIVFLAESPPPQSIYLFAKLHYRQLEAAQNSSVWYNTSQ